MINLIKHFFFEVNSAIIRIIIEKVLKGEVFE
ncbi:hypothetical protein V425_12240 [Lactococcus lactis RTB018]|nr:hypothetical protein V425_12240 [Lactococcus lactis RTB018]